ncbi:MAG: YceD family protein [Chitinophagaceae bacterium]
MASLYELQISTLKIGTHTLEYILDKAFFSQFDQHFPDVQIKVDVQLEKQEKFIVFQFFAKGFIETECERCTNNFPLEIWDEFHLIVRYDINASLLNRKEEDPDIIYILPSQTSFNLEQHLYEFIMLTIPLIVKCNEQQYKEKKYCNQDILKHITNEEDLMGEDLFI